MLAPGVEEDKDTVTGEGSAPCPRLLGGSIVGVAALSATGRSIVCT